MLNLTHYVSRWVVCGLSLLMTLALVSPDERDRGSVVRTTRSGPQRLDAADPADLQHEEPEILVAPAGDLVIDAPVASAAGPEAAAMVPPAFFVPDRSFEILVAVPDPSRVLARPRPTTLGRAPPLG